MIFRCTYDIVSCKQSNGNEISFKIPESPYRTAYMINPNDTKAVFKQLVDDINTLLKSTFIDSDVVEIIIQRRSRHNVVDIPPGMEKMLTDAFGAEKVKEVLKNKPEGPLETVTYVRNGSEIICDYPNPTYFFEK